MSFESLLLEDLAAPQKNAIVGGPFGSNLVSRDYVEQGVPVIRGQNMGGKWVSSDFVFVSPEKAAQLEQNKARPGDVVFTQRGTLGQVSIVPQTPYPEYVVSQSQMKITVDPEKADPQFIYYLFRSEEQLRYVLNSAIQTGVPHTNLGILRKTPVSIPALGAQKAIAEFLCAFDDRITQLRETNATLEAIAQALFKSWFVDFDPVRAKAEGRRPEGMDATTAALFPDGFEESELGLVPKGWNMSTLGAICDANGGVIQTGPFGSQLHASDYVTEGVPVVMPKDISNRRVDASTAARVGLEDVQRLAKHQLRDGDIVFSRRGDVEKHALIGDTEVGWLCGTGCLLVRPGSRRRVAGYLSRSLDLPHTKQWLTQHAVGATMPNLNTGILAAVPVVVPSDEVLGAFDEVTSALDRRISAGNAAAQTLTQLRDTLLPRLISGQLRLPEAEALIEEAV
ncbi:restriction endonuclease subunit S [Ectopseudomonas khazarica]|uniref:restriction endonuclease subunit S n=1 Tax=Ectopseudomonas khazarica TaxID=2502979 RepID=UPI0037C8CCC2